MELIFNPPNVLPLFNANEKALGIAKTTADFNHPENNEIADNLLLISEHHNCKWLSPWTRWNGVKESSVTITFPGRFCIGGVAFKSANDDPERDPR